MAREEILKQRIAGPIGLFVLKREALELAWLALVEIVDFDGIGDWDWHKAAFEIWFRHAAMRGLDSPNSSDTEPSAEDYAVALIEFVLKGLGKDTLKAWGLLNEQGEPELYEERRETGRDLSGRLHRLESAARLALRALTEGMADVPAERDSQCAELRVKAKRALREALGVALEEEKDGDL